MQNKEKLLLNIDETCQVLGIGKNTFCRLVKEGKIPTVKWSKKWLVPRVALEKMLAETKATDTPGAKEREPNVSHK